MKAFIVHFRSSPPVRIEVDSAAQVVSSKNGFLTVGYLEEIWINPAEVTMIYQEGSKIGPVGERTFSADE